MNLESFCEKKNQIVELKYEEIEFKHSDMSEYVKNQVSQAIGEQSLKL